MKTITSKEDFPKAAHLAVVLFSSRWVEGDERSRTDPGHGYPAHSESHVEYLTFEDQKDLTMWIENHLTAIFAVVEATPLRMTKHLNVFFEKAV